MKTKNVFVGLVAVGLMVSMPSAFAAGGMLKACKKELKKFECGAKSEAEAHECLEKHETHDKKNDGFSHACYEAHESYEKKMNKEEKGGESHEEGAEQK